MASGGGVFDTVLEKLRDQGMDPGQPPHRQLHPIPVDNMQTASAAPDPATEFFKKYGRVPTPQELAAFMNPQQPANLAKGGFLTALLRNPEFISRHNLTGSPTGNPIPVDNMQTASAATDPATEFFKKYGRVANPQELAAFVNPTARRMADGGMVPPMEEDMPFMTPQQEAQIYQEAQNLPPEVVQAASGELEELSDDLILEGVKSASKEEISRSVNNIEMSGDFKAVMNSVWDEDEGLETYRSRLAEVVGPEDAQRTPDSVLALVQPTLQLAQIDQGIGALMQEELAEIGATSGGITELATKSAMADGMAAETKALVNAVGGMAQGPSGMMVPNQQAMGMDPMMLQAMMQGAGPTGQGMV
tara:strand:+ start:1236 stop:2318 length:1083 start_codon:yes stop_codon:yes gene_type:complete